MTSILKSNMAWLAAVVLLTVVVLGGCDRSESQTTKLDPQPVDQPVIEVAVEIKPPVEVAPPVVEKVEPKVGDFEANPVGFEASPGESNHPFKSPGAAVGDWPLFRGDQAGSGVARTTLPANDELDVLWEYKVKGRDGAFKGSPIVVRNQSDDRTTVYVADLDGKIYSIDLQTGKWNWWFQTGISVEASPAYKDGHIYIGDMDGQFFCLDEAGLLVWSKVLEAPIVGAANFHGDNVVFGTDDASLYCFNCKDGQQVWKFSAADQIQCSITVSEGTAFVAGCDGHFRIIDLDDGTEKGSVEMGSPTGCTPAVSNGFAVVGTEQAEFVCVDLKENELKWGFADEDGAAAIRGSAAIIGQRVLFGARNRQVYSVNLNTGEQDWTVTLKGRVDGSPVVVGDRMFVGAGDGRLYVLSLDGQVQWTKQLNGPVNNSPAAAFEKLVIATDRGVVYCLGKKEDAQE